MQQPAGVTRGDHGPPPPGFPTKQAFGSAPWSEQSKIPQA